MITQAWGDLEDVNAVHVGVLSGLGQWVYDMWNNDKWDDRVQEDDGTHVNHYT